MEQKMLSSDQKKLTVFRDVSLSKMSTFQSVI